MLVIEMLKYRRFPDELLKQISKYDYNKYTLVAETIGLVWSLRPAHLMSVLDRR